MRKVLRKESLCLKNTNKIIGFINEKDNKNKNLWTKNKTQGSVR